MNSFPFRFRQGSIRSLLAGALALVAAACSDVGQQPAPSRPEAPSEAPPAQVTDVAKDAPVVVFLGDSLTAGYGLEPADALPEQVQQAWKGAGIDAVAVNAGVSGDTTANGLARFDWSVLSAEPDLLVIALGSNDYLMGVPADIARANLSEILTRARSAGIPAVLVGVSVRGVVQPGSREAEFAAIYPELAAEFGVPLYPSLLGEIEGEPALLQSDGLHPTREGVERIAAPLADFLAPLVAPPD